MLFRPAINKTKRKKKKKDNDDEGGLECDCVMWLSIFLIIIFWRQRYISDENSKSFNIII